LKDVLRKAFRFNKETGKNECFLVPANGAVRILLKKGYANFDEAKKAYSNSQEPQVATLIKS
jgi:hypothetical protein